MLGWEYGSDQVDGAEYTTCCRFLVITVGAPMTAVIHLPCISVEDLHRSHIHA